MCIIQRDIFPKGEECSTIFSTFAALLMDWTSSKGRAERSKKNEETTQRKDNRD